MIDGTFTGARWVRPPGGRTAGQRMMTLERKTVSIPRACELVGVSRRTIYNWIAGGKVQYVRTAGGSVRIFVDTLWREPASPLDPSARMDRAAAAAAPDDRKHDRAARGRPFPLGGSGSIVPSLEQSARRHSRQFRAARKPADRRHASSARGPGGVRRARGDRGRFRSSVRPSDRSSTGRHGS